MAEEYREEVDEFQELPREDLTEAIAKTKREWKFAASEKATRHFKEVYEIEMDFARRDKYLAMAGNKMSQKEFERWEDAVADELKLARWEVQRGKLGTKSEAEAMQHMITYCDKDEIGKSVEVRAANYYVERDNDLRLAIRKSGDVEAEDDLAYLNGFLQVATMHLELNKSSAERESEYSFSSYIDKYAELYNTTIKYINGLNRLAQKYGTRAFTPRDFWTSDLCDRRNCTPAIAAIMRYDRDIVGEYCVMALGKNSGEL